MRQFLGSALLLCLATFADAADLKRIQRQIAKEPVYQSKHPRYCLLVFGEQAQQRVWVVDDGNAIYFDRNGNGDLTELGERVAAASSTGRVFKPGNLDVFSGLPLYSNWWFYRAEDGAFEIVTIVGKHPRAGRRLFAGFDPPGQLKFAERAADAPIVHFDGPLELRLMDPPAALTPSQETRLQVVLGTPGLGSGTFAKHGLQQMLPAQADVAIAAGKGQPFVLTAHEG
jgi:hypothetical protein